MNCVGEEESGRRGVEGCGGEEVGEEREGGGGWRREAGSTGHAMMACEHARGHV